MLNHFANLTVIGQQNFAEKLGFRICFLASFATVARVSSHYHINPQNPQIQTKSGFGSATIARVCLHSIPTLSQLINPQVPRTDLAQILEILEIPENLEEIPKCWRAILGFQSNYFHLLGFEIAAKFLGNSKAGRVLSRVRLG